MRTRMLVLLACALLSVSGCFIREHDGDRRDYHRDYRGDGYYGRPVWRE